MQNNIKNIEDIKAAAEIRAVEAQLEELRLESGDALPELTDGIRLEGSDPQSDFVPSVSEYAACVALLLGDDGVDDAVEQVASNRQWLADRQSEGFEPGEVAQFVARSYAA